MEGCLIPSRHHRLESGRIETPKSIARLQSRFETPCGSVNKPPTRISPEEAFHSRRQHVRANVNSTKYYYFYISWPR